MIFVIYLKSVPPEKNSYKKKMKKSGLLKIEKNDDANIYEMKKILIKRKIYIDRKRRRKIHFEFRMK